MDKNVNTASPTGGLNPAVLAKVKIQRKFEIFVEEFDEEGGPGHTPVWKPVKIDPTLGGSGGNPVITVNCQDDLKEKMAFYGQIGQRFRVIREIDPPSVEAIKKAAIEQGLIKETDGARTESVKENNIADRYEREDDYHIHASAKPAEKSETKNDQYVSKPKIVTIGDMQIKYDGDKVYQKQWVRLTPAEAGNFRIVSDTSNKISPMTGKHIEAKRWVLVENTTEDDDQTEDMINA